MLKLDKEQLKAIDKLKTGSILNGGVGSGKSRAAIAYYYSRVGNGTLEINGKGRYSPMKKSVDLYIITTARKRDTLEWQEELVPFGLSTNQLVNQSKTKIIIDSWNNIKKYVDIKDAFFIFDEQKVVGSGTWVKSFLKIVKRNEWILLSATPGDVWMDYIPVFIANGFYKNRTEFSREHRYINTGKLIKYRNDILVSMKVIRHTKPKYRDVITSHNKELYLKVKKERWNIYKDEPIRNASELCYTLRKIVNSDETRARAVSDISKEHDKIIIFYNFDYELEILREVANNLNIPQAEWNGHKHELIPKTDRWLYLVQYNSNAEGWNCIETNAMIFYSQNYSYKIRKQAEGRIDRRNTPFTDLYYYTLRSTLTIDDQIKKAYNEKRDFNENDVYF